jgi:hypothetical protein
MRAGHLARRFAGSLRPGRPRARDEEWARHQLLPGEQRLWERMWNPDRRHAIVVARRVERALGHEAGRPVLAAALLHDVGKVESGLHTYGRVVATLSAAAAGHETALAWSATRGFTRRVGLYVRHPEIGAEMLELAESDPLTVTWTREHHLPPERWSVDRRLADVLKAADDD